MLVPRYGSRPYRPGLYEAIDTSCFDSGNFFYWAEDVLIKVQECGEEEAHLEEEGRYYRLTFLSGKWSHGANEGQEFHMSLEIDMEEAVTIYRDTGEEYYSFNGPLVFEAGTYDGDVYLDPHPYLWIGGRYDDNIHTTGFVLSLSPDDPYFEGAEPIPEPESGSGRRPISLPDV